MTTRPDLRDLRRPVVIAAFGGWNDAGEAASGVIDHLAELTDAAFSFALDPDDFYDFTSNRPVVINGEDGRRIIEWPSIEVLVGQAEGRDVVLMGGPEPNFRWNAFCRQLVSAIKTVRPEKVLVLGAMLADVPHRRPTPLSEDSSDYEGPTGITGVLAQTCREAGFDVTSLWASVPHYVAETANPKATLALLGRVEDILDLTLDAGDLPARAAQWEEQVNELAGDDPDIEAYITTLEEHYDADLDDELADQLGLEAERFLRRRNR